MPALVLATINCVEPLGGVMVVIEVMVDGKEVYIVQGGKGGH